MINVPYSNPLYLAGQKWNPTVEVVGCLQVQYLDSKWGWTIADAFYTEENSTKASEDAGALARSLTAEGRKVRVLSVAVAVNVELA